jgi:hypothetical protein
MIARLLAWLFRVLARFTPNEGSELDRPGVPPDRYTTW